VQKIIDLDFRDAFRKAGRAFTGPQPTCDKVQERIVALVLVGIDLADVRASRKSLRRETKIDHRLWRHHHPPVESRVAQATA
jgi:hypothetical protein